MGWGLNSNSDENVQLLSFSFAVQYVVIDWAVQNDGDAVRSPATVVEKGVGE